jgi:phosphoribosylformylglycinamidine cyclo-ligase
MKAYARAGVDVDLGNRVKSSIQDQVKSTHRSEVLSKVGGFGGLFAASFKGYKDPVLVSSIDGVGTKLKVASLLERHDTIGEDLVNHCVNDIAVVGAEPLFFLDYIGTASLDPHTFKDILAGLVRGCKKAGCALIGGETAQMPGIYHGRDYDLVGCIIGIVERKKIIDGKGIKPGDVILGLSSSGLHTNGYSLAREVLFNRLGLRVHDYLPGYRIKVGEALLRTHINYLPQIKKIREKVKIKGLAHITGGGMIDNLPRVLPKGTEAVIELGSWTIPPLFKFLANASGIDNNELYQVFNMGVGMTIIVDAKDAPKVRRLTGAFPIGFIADGNQQVRLI